MGTKGNTRACQLELLNVCANVSNKAKHHFTLTANVSRVALSRGRLLQNDRARHSLELGNVTVCLIPLDGHAFT